MTAGKRPCWQALLRLWRHNREPLPKALVAALIAAGTDTLAEATMIYPEKLAATAVERLPLRAILPAAFRYPVVAHAVECRYDRAHLRAQISWARDRWTDRPSYATAYEVALAFSLPDARFLVSLARSARAPAEPGQAGRVYDHLYHTYTLPKRTGGQRLITVPDERLQRLQRLQRRLLDAGFNEIRLPGAAHGFRRGRSILTNVLPHVGQALVVNVDIDSFFPSTTFPPVARACALLARGRLSKRARMFVADLCSYNGALPTGAPTSPAIANIVLARADRALTRVAARHGIAYTRYADDLTFSGGDKAKRIIPFVTRVLGELGYQIDERKLNLYRRGRRQIVAGLVVNEKPNIPRRVRRRLRAAVHRQSTNGTPTWHGRPMEHAELVGRLAYLHLVQPEEARRHRERLAAAASPDVTEEEQQT